MKKFLKSDWPAVIFLFLSAAAIRTIPELKAGVWPIGYDTFNTYAAELASYNGPLINWVRTANILYFIFLPFKAAGIVPDTIMKIVGPLLYGGLIVSFYFFVKKFLKFDAKKSFLAALLLLLQLGSLRISWDLYRNELSLIFLFLAMINLANITRPKNLFYFCLLGGLVTLSNELVTVLLLIITLVYWFYFLFKKRWQGLAAISIPLVIFGTIFAIVVESSGQVLYDKHIIFMSERNYFWRYFYRYNLVIPYWLLKQIIGQLFWLLYGFLLPFAIIGIWYFRKNLVLIILTGWLLAGTFSSLLFNGNGILVWERWLFMLVFPMVIFATEGIYRLGEILSRPRKWAKKMPKLAYATAVVFWIGLLGFFAFRAKPFLMASYAQARPPLANDELNNYFPRTMVHNSVGLFDMKSTLAVVKWLNKNVPSGAVVIVDNRYRGVMITRFDIDNRYIITNSWSEKIQVSTLDLAKKLPHRPVYLIWNTSKAIDNFDRVYAASSKGVYEALPSFYD